MLRSLNYLLISISCGLSANPVSNSKSCQTSSIIEPARKNGCYQSSSAQDSFATLFQQESLRKVEALQKDPSFQNIISGLQNNSSQESTDKLRDQHKKANGELYLFISFSMGEKALLNLAQEAKQFGAPLVLRGFKEGSYAKTAKALQKIITETGQGVLIDPELYSLFHITVVPTFVLAKTFALQAQTRIQTPIHDKLQGHVSVRYALEAFSKEGALKDEARALLNQGAAP